MQSATVGNDATRVLIGEDTQVVADGLAALINDQPDMTVIGQAGSVADSLARAAELKPDVVLIDFRLTDGTGADAAAGIRQIRPETRLIFLTREDSDAVRFTPLGAAASAFIHNDPPAPRAEDPIRTPASGAAPAPPPATPH